MQTFCLKKFTFAIFTMATTKKSKKTKKKAPPLDHEVFGSSPSVSDIDFPENVQAEKDGVRKKKKKKRNTVAQAEVPGVQDSESEPDETGNYVNWKGINVGGLKDDGDPAVETLYVRKKCKSCGARSKYYCGYRGYQWRRWSENDPNWTRID